jgi:hypothetical protein
MHPSRPLLLPASALAFLVSAVLGNPLPQNPEEVHAPLVPDPGTVVDGGESTRVHAGEKIDPATCGPSVIESMEAVAERAAMAPLGPPHNHKARNGAQGWWAVPSRRRSAHAHSGEHYAMNKWGDTRMGVSFGRLVDLEGAFFAGQGAGPLWARGLRILGYRDGDLVSRSEWLDKLSAESQWFAAGLERIDRIEIEARPAYRGSGWYALDDLTFTERTGTSGKLPTRIVVDFDDLGYHERLSGSRYAGLLWEIGTGDFDQETEVVHAPKTPPDSVAPEQGGRLDSGSGRSATAPTIVQDFAGPKIFDAGAGWLPPDTCGSVGIDHFVAVVNQNLSVYEKATGNRVINTSLQTFFNTGGASAGDPRCVFDPDSERFILLATDFGSNVFLAVSTTSDPTGSWFKTAINVSQGSDAGKWPDYPTLGVDAEGIYTGAYMVGGGMSLFAIDKAPLIAATPSLGTVTAFRNLPWEGAIQPCVTHGDPGKGYCISRKNGSVLRLRYVQGPLTLPTLVEAGQVSVPSNSAPPNAPALGSVSPLDCLDGRPMNAVYRNGSVWMTHGIAVDGKAGCRWYEINAASASTVQVGTVSDSEMYYFMPGIAVNSRDEVILGFSGSNASQYAGAYLSGRMPSDSAGELSTPLLLQAGNAAYNSVGSGGVNRWGDYSLSSIDPVDDTTLWTIQEHTRASDQWGTWIGRAEYSGCDPLVNYCFTSPNSVGPGAVISGLGYPSLAVNDFRLLSTGCPPNQFLMYYYGAGPAPTVFGNGWRCANAGGVGVFRFSPFLTNSSGNAVMNVDFTQPPAGTGGGSGQWFAGDIWYCQGWYRDPAGGGAQFNLTDGLRVTVCP